MHIRANMHYFRNIPLIFQIPILLLAPENENYFGTKWLTKWDGCWMYHFPSGTDLLDHQYPVVIVYNGIHHYVSTFIVSTRYKDKAVLKVMSTMITNLIDLSKDLQGEGSQEVKKSFTDLKGIMQNLLTQLAVEDLAEFTSPFGLVPAPPPVPGQSSETGPSSSAEKKVQM